MNIEERFFKIFSDVMEVDYEKKHYSMSTLRQWDSLKTIELIMELQKEFSIKFNHRDIIKLTDTKNIIEIISKYKDGEDLL